MVRHVRYLQERYRSAPECLAAIRAHLERGWWLSSLEGPSHGAYIATFGIDDDGPRLVETY